MLADDLYSCPFSFHCREFALRCQLQRHTGTRLSIPRGGQAEQGHEEQGVHRHRHGVAEPPRTRLPGPELSGAILSHRVLHLEGQSTDL